MSLYEDIKNGKEKIALVGLGYVGMPIAVAFAKKVKVVGFDLNKEKIAAYLKEGRPNVLRLAQNDHPMAQYLIGLESLFHGKNISEAVTWFERAARQESALAQNTLGLMYYTGNGVEKDVHRAALYFRQAAASGDRRSSCAALVLRGDMILADGGDGQDNLRKALTDGYLRAALMYGDEECKEVRSDAMLKAAKEAQQTGK